MRDKSDWYQIQSVSTFHPPMKKLGSYLVDAGLLTTDQINVVLNDQQATGMRFGDIVVARGWVKEQTIEWIVTKVVEPERKSTAPQRAANHWGNGQPAASRSLQPASPQTVVPADSPGRCPNPVTPTAKNSTAAAGQPTAGQPTAGQPTAGQPTMPTKPFVRREVPISKPLPSVSSPDGDVNWVG